MSYNLCERTGIYHLNHNFFRVYEDTRTLRKLNKPIWYIFGGNITDRPEYLNGYCKDLENFLSFRLRRDYSIENIYDYISIMGVVYGFSDGDGTKGLSEKDCFDFAQTRLLPLFLDSNGNLLNKEECKKNLSQINFFSHSYGAEAIYNIFEILKKLVKCKINEERELKPNRMSDLLCDKDIQDVFNSCFHISYAPVVDSTYIPTVRIKSLKDGIYPRSYVEYVKSNLSKKKLNGISIKHYEPFDDIFNYFKPECFSPCLEIWSSCLLNDKRPESIIDEHQMCVLRDCDDELRPTDGCSSNGVYSVVSKNADCVSNIMSSIIESATIRSIENSQTLGTPVINVDMKDYYDDAKDIHACYHLDELTYQELPKIQKIKLGLNKLIDKFWGR
jgi:hypothetical protein